MKKMDKEFKQLLYDLMNGSLDLENNAIEESRYVEDEFSEGKVCQIAYAEILDAYQRICERLGLAKKIKTLKLL